MQNHWRHTGMVLASAALFTGCLIKDVRHIWYLDPASGALNWTVFEDDVRSDAASATDRDLEELAFWREVQAEQHATARAFRQLGAAEIRTRILRARPPYGIVTDATFPSIDELGRRLLVATGLVGSSTLAREDNAMVWTMIARDPHAEDRPPDDDVTALIGDLDSLRIVLAHGRFEEATGFRLDRDHRVATFTQEDVDQPVDDAMMVLRLRWTLSLAASASQPCAVSTSRSNCRR